MAKKEKEKAASLPKQIAGVKIPKALREQLTALAKNPLVADLLAAGLVALAASLRNNPKVKEAAANAKGKAAGAASGVANAATNVAEAATKLGAVIASASPPKAASTKKPAAPKPAKAPAKKTAAPKAAAKPAAPKRTTAAKKPPTPKSTAAAKKPAAPAKPKTAS